MQAQYSLTTSHRIRPSWTRRKTARILEALARAGRSSVGAYVGMSARRLSAAPAKEGRALTGVGCLHRGGGGGENCPRISMAETFARKRAADGPRRSGIWEGSGSRTRFSRLLARALARLDAKARWSWILAGEAGGRSWADFDEWSPRSARRMIQLETSSTRGAGSAAAAGAPRTGRRTPTIWLN